MQAPKSPAWNPAQRALLWFDLGLPAGAVIDAVQLNLKLSVSGGADSVALRAYQVTLDWLEARVTWNNKPTWGSLYAQTTVGAGAAWYAWDVTEIARAWQQGSNYGLLMEPTTPTDAPGAERSPARSPRGTAAIGGHLPSPGARPLCAADRPSRRRVASGGAELHARRRDHAATGERWQQLDRQRHADAAGTLWTLCIVPLVVPIGAATLNAHTLTGSLLTSTAVQIVVGPTLQLTPASGPPGTVVQYAATNLVAGSLRLDYAGVPLVGPRPVMGGSASGSFVVPADRPSPLGSATVVKAVNIAGKLLPARRRPSSSHNLPRWSRVSSSLQPVRPGPT